MLVRVIALEAVDTFWHRLPKPFLALAPLEGVADTAFRRVVAECAKPDVFFTEFTSADGFCSPGKEHVMQNLLYTPAETPLVAQLWGNNPVTLKEAAKEIARMGFAGIDLNTGCPDRTVVKNGSGSGLIKTPDLAAQAIQAMKEGVSESGHDVPVSVKTRIGFNKIITEEWITHLLRQGIAALTVHGRTREEMSKVPAHWDEIGKAVEIRNRLGLDTVIIGNGDVENAAEAAEKANQYGVDGVMIGRGIFHNMWAFDKSIPPHEGTPQEYLAVMERHIRLFAEVWGDTKNYAILKKFYKIYVNNFYGATEWRVKFMETSTAEEALSLLNSILNIL